MYSFCVHCGTVMHCGTCTGRISGTYRYSDCSSSSPPTTHSSSPHHTLCSHTCAPPSELIHPNFQVCEDQPQLSGVATVVATEPLDHPNFKAAEVTRPHLASCWTKYILPTGEQTRGHDSHTSAEGFQWLLRGSHFSNQVSFLEFTPTQWKGD